MPHRPPQTPPPQQQVSQAAAQMARAGQISQPVAALFSRADRSVQVPNLDACYEDPVMSCFVVDASPSMAPYRDDVIEGQKVAVNTLRSSAKCANNALYVAQWLFSGRPTQVNPFSELSPQPGDGVVLLQRSNYDPEAGDGTALYDTVFHVLQEMMGVIAYSRSGGLKTTFTVGVITDGDDNASKTARPDDVQKIVQELRGQNYLRKSVVIGLKNKDFPPAKVTAIQQALGFDEAVSVSQDPREIRRAFLLASQFAISAQK